MTLRAKLIARLSAALFLCCLLANPQSAQAESHLKISTLNQEEVVADWITFFDQTTEEKRINANGSIIGLFGQWFTMRPYRIDDWFSLARNETLKAQAITALAMIDQHDKAVELATQHNVSPQAIWRSNAYKGGKTWPSGGADQNLTQAIKSIKPLATRQLTYGWEQDVLWVSAFVSREGVFVQRIMTASDRQYAAAAKQDPLAYAFVGAAVWSLKSNAARFPFITTAISEYRTQNPNSPTGRLLDENP